MLLVLDPRKGHEVVADKVQLELAEELFKGKKVVVEGDTQAKARELLTTGYSLYEATFNERGGVTELVERVYNPLVVDPTKSYAALLPMSGG